MTWGFFACLLGFFNYRKSAVTPMCPSNVGLLPVGHSIVSLFPPYAEEVPCHEITGNTARPNVDTLTSQKPTQMHTVQSLC